MAQKIHLDFTAASQQAKIPSAGNSATDIHEGYNREVTLSASYMPMSLSTMLSPLSASFSANTSPPGGWTGDGSSGDLPTPSPADTRQHTELHRSTAQLAFRMVFPFHDILLDSVYSIMNFSTCR